MRRKILSFKGIAAAIVLCLFCLPRNLLAQNDVDNAMSTTLSVHVLNGLEQSAQRFRASGEQGAVEFVLQTADSKAFVRLEPHDIRAPGYVAQLTTDNGVVPDPVQVDLFRGQIMGGSDGDFARFSLVRLPQDGSRRLKGFLSLGGEYYDVQPVDGTESGLRVSRLSQQRVKELIASCGVDHSMVEEARERRSLAAAHAHAHGHPSDRMGTMDVKVVEIATDADFEYTQAKGGESGANAAIVSILNAVDAIYQAQLDLKFSVTFQNAFTTSSDPYTTSNSSNLLNEFRNHWEQNFRSSVTYDVAHLWTGRNLNSGVAGVAFLSAVCSSFGYGLSQIFNSSELTVPLAAHEIGHNFGSDHDNCDGGAQFIMCPFLISGISTFSDGSKTQIGNFVNGINCLSTDDGGGGGSNQAPVLGSIGPKSVNEGQALEFFVTATDPNSDTITYGATPLATGMQFSTITGAFSYTPPAGTVPDGFSSTTVSVTFSATDTGLLSDSELVVITISKGNSAPTFSAPGTVQVAAGQLVNVQLSATDPDGDAITYSNAAALPSGVVLNGSTGLVSWVPTNDQVGTNALSFVATDNQGASSAVATLTVVVSAGNGGTNPSDHTEGDFDGNDVASIAIFRPVTGEWFLNETATGNSTKSGPETIQFGLSGDVPVVGDYDGDHKSDLAVFRPQDASWHVRNSATGAIISDSFGLSSDLPVPGDYDGDGRTDLGVFRPSVGQFVYKQSSNSATNTFSIGQSGDLPLSCDFDGDNKTDVAVFQPETGNWKILNAQGQTNIVFGTRTDIPVPADYDGDGSCDIAVWRPTTGEWLFQSDGSIIQFGLGGDFPAAADYNGDGDIQLAVFRPSGGFWIIRNSDGSSAATQFGLPSDSVSLREWFYYAMRNTNAASPSLLGGVAQSAAVYRRDTSTLFTISNEGTSSSTVAAGIGSYVLRGDYNGDGEPDTASVTNGVWLIYFGNSTEVSTVFWGTAGDVPVAGDFDGDGKTDVTVYRPEDSGSLSAWYVIKSSDGTSKIYNWGLSTDQPIPADFNGDGWTDPTVWRPGDGIWYVLDARSGVAIQATQWGLNGDIVRTADFDADGRADKVVFRNSEGRWYVLTSGGGLLIAQWGLPGDIPVPGTYLSSNDFDFAVYRPSSGTLFVLGLSGVQSIVPAGLLPTDRAVGFQPPIPLE